MSIKNLTGFGKQGPFNIEEHILGYKTGKDKVEVLYRVTSGLVASQSEIIGCIRWPYMEELRFFHNKKSQFKRIAKWLTRNDVELAVVKNAGPYWEDLYDALKSYRQHVVIVKDAHLEHSEEHCVNYDDARCIAVFCRFSHLEGQLVPKNEPIKPSPKEILNARRLSFASGKPTKVQKLESLKDTIFKDLF